MRCFTLFVIVLACFSCQKPQLSELKRENEQIKQIALAEKKKAEMAEMQAIKQRNIAEEQMKYAMQASELAKKAMQESLSRAMKFAKELELLKLKHKNLELEYLKLKEDCGK